MVNVKKREIRSCSTFWTKSGRYIYAASATAITRTVAITDIAMLLRILLQPPTFYRVQVDLSRILRKTTPTFGPKRSNSCWQRVDHVTYRTTLQARHSWDDAIRGPDHACWCQT